MRTYGDQTGEEGILNIKYVHNINICMRKHTYTHESLMCSTRFINRVVRYIRDGCKTSSGICGRDSATNEYACEKPNGAAQWQRPRS